MNILDAAHALAHHYPGGATALGIRMGMSGKLLSNKLNPTDDRHVLTALEALRMQQLTGDHRIIRAEADELGYVLIPTPTNAAGDEDISHAVCLLCAEFGDYMRKVNDSLADGKISTNERRDLERELAEMIAAATHLQSILASKA